MSFRPIFNRVRRFLNGSDRNCCWPVKHNEDIRLRVKEKSQIFKDDVWLPFFLQVIYFMPSPVLEERGLVESRKQSISLCSLLMYLLRPRPCTVDFAFNWLYLYCTFLPQKWRYQVLTILLIVYSCLYAWGKLEDCFSSWNEFLRELLRQKCASFVCFDGRCLRNACTCIITRVLYV